VLRVFGLGAGDLGVDVFFFISGFLVIKSFLGKSIAQFVWARCMRIFPGLWVSSVLLVLAAGLFFSPLPAMEFWSRHDTLTYLARNATMLPGIGCQETLPYALNAKDAAFNTSLWTLPHELQMYMLLAALGLLGGLRFPLIVGSVALIGAAAVVANKLFGIEALALDRARFLYFFFSGASAYLLRDRLVLSWRWFVAGIVVMLAVIAASSNHVLRQAALAGVLPYLVLWLAYVPKRFVRGFNRAGDYSYGIYIYALPIQLALFATTVGSQPIANFTLTMLIVLLIAAASWHWLESRALRIPVPAVAAPRTPKIAPATSQSDRNLK
jgi:peptidoglycan/LPS O-acetylase OafA/YrhL